jgi:2-oxoglutarate dehydrogenase E1 component
MNDRNVSEETIRAILESFGPNAGLVEELLREYLNNPAAVSASWQKYFGSFLNGGGRAETAYPQEPPHPPALAPERPEEQTGHVPSIALRGVAAKIVENMEASLSLPTATSIRTIPVKVLEENRRLLNQHLAARTGGKISFTHIIAYAMVTALHDFPNLNASFTRIAGVPHKTERPRVNVGLAIDLTRKDGTRALVVPNVKDAGSMDFAAFVNSYEDIVRRARKNALEPSDFLETSITLTNPGTVGTVASIPRLMPGQGAIIASGAIDYPAETRGMSAGTLSTLGISKVMTLTCTYDHRVIQGAESGQFLARIHSLLLGEERFYDLLFSHLHIPYEPVRWSTDQPVPSSGSSADLQEIEKQARVLQLINAYRVRGHLIGNLDPLVDEPHNHPELDPGNYGLTLWDLDRRFVTGGLAGRQTATLREILEILRKTYCGTVGVEYMNIQDPIQKRWLQERMEPGWDKEPIAPERQRQILRKLVAAEGLEKFLHTKFIGHKRFSLEGAESLMAIMDTLLDDAAHAGVREILIGMSHRGRLNILANTIGKPLAKIFSEFEGYVDPSSIQGTGDVKYHLGATGMHTTPGGKQIVVAVAPNPSHLESVNPVVEGMVRAKQDRYGDTRREQVIPVLIHGDAAFAGQGIVAETLNLSQLQGYRTGGTVHVIINNQIGFTTLPDDARSTPYCTDVARMVQAPIFHINGDDVEACVKVTRLALEYRQRFKKDVVIDMICYRRHGHNEGDEPSYTQPLLYRRIKHHPSVTTLYAETLQRAGMPAEEIESTRAEARKRYDRAFEASKMREMHFRPEVPLAVPPKDLEEPAHPGTTAVSSERLAEVIDALTTVPPGFALNPKLSRMLDERRQLASGSGTIDWAFAEALAFGTLVCEGTPVRLSGQDSARGTFSQRHLVLHDGQSGREHVPLNNIRADQATFSVFDSLLSEAAVMGFEFGYSAADPLALVLWEAQFGDFSNGAQVIIDQFIAGSESKWQEPCDLVLLLPHGYEGQGPEHSSARLERFLQLCAEENMQVCNCTTPAQYFHLLRRQVRDQKRKPLVVMTPKSLLRHPRAVSSIDEFTAGRFSEIVDDAGSPNPGVVERVIFCSGKISYDLLAARQPESGTAIVRIEQLYPFPSGALQSVLRRYSRTREAVWVQEEPENMGAWRYVRPIIQEYLGSGQHLSSISRPAAASPATGSLKAHQREQEEIIRRALAPAGKA